MPTARKTRANRYFVRRESTPSPTRSGEFKDGKGKTNISYSLALAQRSTARRKVFTDTELLEMAQ